VKTNLLVVYIALIAVPLVVLGWLGARAIGQEREMLDRNIQALLVEQMSVYDDEIQRLLGSWVQDWESTTWDVTSPDELRNYINQDGRITQFFHVDQDGSVIYPASDEMATDRELSFLERTDSVWSSGAIHPNQLVDTDTDSTTTRFTGKAKTKSSQPRGRWYEWYWGDGLQLMYWWSTESGTIYGIEVSRVRLLAEIIGELPDTSDTVGEHVIGTQLLNESGHMLYQWGSVAAAETQLPSFETSLSAPLGAWSLRAHVTNYSGVSTGNALLLGVGLVCLALVLTALGIYFYRENTRELREATQRVNFVNHVSHELKTPLTNIRMYAELLQEQMDPEREQEIGRLGVILSESQRLSRLITNVLTFNQRKRSALTLRPVLTNFDELIAHVLSHFEKSFVQHDIEVHVEGNIPGEVCIDPDVVEQILGNLLSNVEKYARKSRDLEINVTKTADLITVTVADHGPGIDRTERQAIFTPFYRIQDSLSEGVSGTGIGLSIARDLARLHGGDLELVPSESGAHFVVRLAIQGES
jgi:signal transduction histidine kinase